jgi:hypothetical protein
MFCGWAKVALGGAPGSEKLQLGQELQVVGIKGRRLGVYKSGSMLYTDPELNFWKISSDLQKGG